MNHDIEQYNKLRIMEMEGWKMENSKPIQEKKLGAWWLLPSIIGGAVAWWFISSAIWKALVN